jgi:AraC family transcriptional regulator
MGLLNLLKHIKATNISITFSKLLALHLSQIQHIISFIEHNSDKYISSKELEKISNSSYRNLQRIFKKVFNESTGAFQKRLKLENGYKKLIYTKSPVGDIAIEVGFESAQSFSKAFKKKFGIAPSAARNEKETLFTSFFPINKEDAHHIRYEIVYLKPRKVYFKAIQTNNYNNQDIDRLWDKIDNDIKSDAAINYYGIIVDEPLITDSAKCRYEAAIDKEVVRSDYFSKYIFGGNYAKVTHKGSYDNIENTYRKVYSNWLFNSILEFDSSPIIEHYTVTNTNEKEENNFVTEILIPIKKK